VGEFPPEASPEPLHSIDMISPSFDVVPFSMIHQTGDISPGGDSGVGLPGIGTDDGSWLYLFRDEREECSCLSVVDDISPYLAITAENAEYRLL